MGYTFRLEPQAEAVSQNLRLEWDALSETALKRKLRPGIRLQNGMPFLVEPLAESSSQKMAPERDALSETALKRKVCPVLEPFSGVRFPPGMPFGKCVPV